MANISVINIPIVLFKVAALMGAHTLGSMSRNNSGYRGPWISGEANKFDNRYYRLMVKGEEEGGVFSWKNEVIRGRRVVSLPVLFTNSTILTRTFPVAAIPTASGSLSAPTPATTSLATC